MSRSDDVQHYCKMRYAVELTKQEEGWFFARIPDLPGCMSEGKTPEEAMRSIEEAKRLWIEGSVESEYEIPLPSHMRKHSGKFLVRLPASLHERLVEAADRDGVSLNQYICCLLSEGVAARKVESIRNEVDRLLSGQWPTRVWQQEWPKVDAGKTGLGVTGKVPVLEMVA